MTTRGQAVALFLVLLLVMAAPCYGCGDGPDAMAVITCGGCR